MFKKFEFKLEKKSVKLNLETSNVKKIVLKFIGVYGREKITFSTKVNIKLNSNNINNINNLIEKVEIVELDVDNYNNNSLKRNVYTLDSSSSTSSQSVASDEEIYDQVMKFIKNIKFIADNNKLSSVVFSLEKTNIKKVKVKGKIN
jgi:hypothetical protein